MMIEINRRIYMNELTGEPLGSFQSTREATGKLLSTAMDFLLNETSVTPVKGKRKAAFR
jgi:N-formylglutamate deformylase